MTADGSRAPRLPREERRKQVLAAAREVFVAVGYHNASMDDIAERAGVSKPVLYQHFPGKLDLYLALLDAGIEDLHRTAVVALRGTTDNKLRVNGIVGAYFEFIDDTGGAYRLVFESDLANEPLVRQRLDSIDLEIARETAAIIAEDTGLNDDQALLLAFGLQGLLHTAARWWQRGEMTLDRAAAAELVAALSWRGISGFPMSHPPTEESGS